MIVSPNEVLEKLTEDIDLENIPKDFGGGFDYQPAMLPSITEEFWQKINSTGTANVCKIPPGPIRWVRDDSMDKAVAVGRDDGISRRFDVLSMPAEAEYRK